MSVDFEEKERAYRATTYWVEAPAAWIGLRGGERDEALERLLAAGGFSTWAFVTSDNPRGCELPLSPAENAGRRVRLDAELAGRGWLPGYGVGDDGCWPPEISRWVPGITRRQALELGRRHGQVAILFGEAGGVAELLACEQ